MGYYMKENHRLYRQYVDYFYGELDIKNINFEALKKYVINQLKTYGISKATKEYLYRRKFDRTNDYMLDNTDAMELYCRRSNPSYKRVCAVLLQEYLNE